MNNYCINEQFSFAVVEISEGRYVIHARQGTANLVSRGRIFIHARASSILKCHNMSE